MIIIVGKVRKSNKNPSQGIFKYINCTHFIQQDCDYVHTGIYSAKTKQYGFNANPIFCKKKHSSC